MTDFMTEWLRTGAVPDWMKEYSKRDVSLMMYAVQHADEYHLIAPHHPLAIHCREMKAMVEGMNALEAKDKQTQDGATS